MELAATDERIAEVALQLKHQFQAVLSALPDYGSDAHVAREVDRLGELIKQLEDTIVFAQVRAAGESA